MSAITDRNRAANVARVARSRTARPRPRPRYLPLFYRLAGINALLVTAAMAVTIALLAPGKVSAAALDEELAVVVLAIALVVAANVYLLGRIVRPVQALTAFAREVDFSRLGQRVPADA